MPPFPLPRRIPLLLHRTFTTTLPRPVAKISIVGRLAAEPEISATTSGSDVIRYAVGTATGPKDNRTTSWWKVSSFAPEGPQRDYLMGLGKGSLVYVDGNCSMKKFQDKDGNPQSAMAITQRHIEVLERRDSDASRQGGDPDA